MGPRPHPRLPCRSAGILSPPLRASLAPTWREREPVSSTAREHLAGQCSPASTRPVGTTCLKRAGTAVSCASIDADSLGSACCAPSMTYMMHDSHSRLGVFIVFERFAGQVLCAAGTGGYLVYSRASSDAYVAHTSHDTRTRRKSQRQQRPRRRRDRDRRRGGGTRAPPRASPHYHRTLVLPLVLVTLLQPSQTSSTIWYVNVSRFSEIRHSDSPVSLISAVSYM